MRDPGLSADIQRRLRCPMCRGMLRTTGEIVCCTRPGCAARFPIVDSVPILLNEMRSVFSTKDFVLRRDTTFQVRQTAVDKQLHRLLNLLPHIGGTVRSKRNYANFAEALLQQTPAPKVLIVGGSILGEGMSPLTVNPAFELVATDVSFGPLTALVCDAHDIPFDDDTFDGVVVQAVLEHVVDPYRCVDEIHRVLKMQGLVYAETPFIQQVHMGPYDFTRFTHSGHRWLFRDFDEIASGPIGGPAMALAWSYEYFLLSFATSRIVRGFMRAFARLSAFYLKYLDYYLIEKPGAFDAASGFFFLGRKEGHALSDRELIDYYRGSGLSLGSRTRGPARQGTASMP